MNGFLIKTKLIFIVLLALATLSVVGAAGWSGITHVSNTMEQMGNRILSVVTLMGIRTEQLISAGELKNALNIDLSVLEALADKQDAVAEVKGHIGSAMRTKLAADEKAHQYFDAYKVLEKTEAEAAEWEAFESEWQVYVDAHQNLIDPVLDDISQVQDWGLIPGKIEMLRGDTEHLMRAMQITAERLDKLIEINSRMSTETREVSEKTSRAAITIMASIFLIGAAGLAGVGFLVVRSVVGSLENMRKTIIRVSQDSDFTNRLGIKGKDELAQTSQAFNELMSNMQNALSAVLSNATSVSEAARKARGAAERVSASSGAQHEAAAAMAAAMEQMTVSIGHISESSHDARARARDTGVESNYGAEIISRSAEEMVHIVTIVQSAGEAMSEVGRQSDHISNIIQVIRDVADQTNLLALNAAIEAARAGEQGRGFAVVADEVRKLAERTARSATEITEMILAMQNKARSAIVQVGSVEAGVAQGKNLSAQATERMTVIHHNADYVADAIDGISTALGEQSLTAQDIAHKVETVARMSEENRSAASDTVSIAAELDALSEMLRIAAGRFKV